MFHSVEPLVTRDASGSTLVEIPGGGPTRLLLIGWGHASCGMSRESCCWVDHRLADRSPIQLSKEAAERLVVHPQNERAGRMKPIEFELERPIPAPIGQVFAWLVGIDGHNDWMTGTGSTLQQTRKIPRTYRSDRSTGAGATTAVRGVIITWG